jgi:hypothetical protein
MQKLKINFLAAADGTALTKQYTKEEGGTFTTNPYPNVKNFNSFEYEVGSLEDWLEALKAHSDVDHCFLKGNLKKKLENESRAGHTSSAELTRTALFDLDFNDGFKDIEDFLTELDPAFRDVSYILHHSNSAGITGPAGLRAHIAFVFEQAKAPDHLKAWLQHKNLTVKALRERITLSANGMSLKYPLDVTTCQNDKIIYTARPQCTNFDDPLDGTRIQLIKKTHETVTGKIDFVNPQILQQMVDDRIKELREEQGLKARKAKYTNTGRTGVPTLANPDKAAVTGTRQNGKFVYLNLNNGDSWGYFHSREKPDLLYNFKGEPNCHLRDIVPEYYQTLETNNGDKDLVPMVFRERGRDQYYNLVYNPNTKDIDSLDPVGSKPRMIDFMKQFGQSLPDPILDWKVEFNPTTNEVFNERNLWINSFRPTAFMKADYDPIPRIPYIIDKILTSICVDEEYKAFFINWLAYLYQYRMKSIVCPIFHGVQGTGKGLLQEKILQPLFGHEHTPKITTQQLQDQFNGWTEKALIAVWDEAEQNTVFDGGIYDKAKNLISEEHITLRLMRQNPVKIRSYLNLMVFTNHPYPFPLEHGDRRFAPAPPQLNQLEISEAEVDAIADELEMFAAYLQNYQVNTRRARTILKNQAREDMIKGSANTVDAFFHALHDGDMDYFLSFMRDTKAVTPEPTYNDYVRSLRRWANDVDSQNITIVTQDEARFVYSYIIKKFDSPGKFRKMGGKYHFKEGRGMVNGVRGSGWKINWKIEDREALAEFLKPDIAKLKAV